MYNYREYYRKLFEDSGIWNKNIIIQNYNFDSKLRLEEIYDLINEKLSNNLLIYQDNIAKIKWRSKYLIVTFYDENENRIISDLEIR